MRGKQKYIFKFPQNPRITPAGAGKTQSGGRGLLLCRDHPRRCGENLDVARHFENGAGSPPQVRGKRRGNRSQKRRTGITPAGAGKTTKTDAKSLAGQDHPRRCGENSSPCSKRLQASGSPPQVRGKPSIASALRVRGRITPAGAGKTDTHRPDRAVKRDHPRRCGENTKKIL